MPGPTKIVKLMFKNGATFDAATRIPDDEIINVCSSDNGGYMCLSSCDNNGRDVPVFLRPFEVLMFAIVPIETIREASPANKPSIVRPN